MVFSSATFLFIFLPAVWVLYSLLPRRALGVKNFILAASSLVFYAFGEPVYVLIMLASVTFNYVVARLIGAPNDAASERRRLGRRAMVAIAVVANLLLLFVFKYVPWLTGVVNSALGTSIPVPALTIPVGISFYTFQILSYVIDVYRGKCDAQRNYLRLFLYISFFPQLIAGPIVKYGDIADQIAHREMTVEKTARGVRRFIFGFAKKVLISNSAALVADAAFGAGDLSSLFAWAGAICYCIQLYFDFSGYSDMAIGLASMFGFELGENFNYPYAAVSIRDFWRRWHISLTSWFREYVYFPLGGNRRGKARTVFNRVVIFFLTGAWHGANFTFIVWGLWHGALMMAEELLGVGRLEKKRALRPILRVYTLLAVCVGFVVFRAPSLTAAVRYLGAMFSFSGTARAFELFSPWVIIFVCAGIASSVPLVPRLRAAISRRSETVCEVLSYAASAVVFALAVAAMVSSAFNPFIYYIF